MKAPARLALNPSGVVPTLVDGSLLLPEGVAILLHLVDENPEAEIGPAAGSPARTELHRWLSYLTGTLHPYFWPHFMPMRFTSDESGHAAVQKASHNLISKALSVIDQHLEGRDWMVGESKSVADAFLYPMANWGYGLDKPTSSYPNIHRLMCKLAADPAVRAVHGAQGTESLAGLAKEQAQA